MKAEESLPGTSGGGSIKGVTARDWGGHRACAEISVYGGFVESDFRCGSLLSEPFDLESFDPAESDALAL